MSASTPRSAPRLLYVGNLLPGANGPDRAQSFEQAGFEVEGFDIVPFQSEVGLRPERSLAWRLNVGRPLARFNRALRARAAQGGYDILFVDKGTWVYRDTLHALRDAATTRLAVHYTPDAQFFLNRSRHFLTAIPDYDLHVTTKPFELDHYRKAGAREVLFILQGYGRRVDPAHQFAAPPELRSDICFVGHRQPHYAARLRALAEIGDLAIWGPTWPRHARRHAWARPVVRGDALWGDAYSQALVGSKIAIGLLSKYIPETTTTRTFEIPALGAFMLAERTDDHLALFEEGVEAEYFGSDEEMRDKARFYLANDATRRRIAAAGRKRSIKSGYSVDAQFKRIADWMTARLCMTPAAP